MTKLRSLVERTGIALFLVSHLRRSHTDQGHEEGARVTLGQLRGSAAIAQLSDACIALERDQQDGSQHTGTTGRVLKNRYSGKTGVACTLQYDLNTCQFTENEVELEFNTNTDSKLIPPNPPTAEAVKRAQFVDRLMGGNGNDYLRSGGKRFTP